MAQLYKNMHVQGTASTGTYATLYNVPAGQESLISTILICNTDTVNPITIRIGTDDNAGTPDVANGEFLVYDAQVAAGDTLTLSLGLALGAGKYLRVSSSDTAANFTAFVIEMGIADPPDAAGNNTELQYNDNGVLGASSNLTFNGTDELQLTDNTKLTLGTGNDADIYYDGSNMFIHSAVSSADSKLVVGTATFGTQKLQILNDHDGREVLGMENNVANPYGLTVDFSAASPDNNANWFFRGMDSTANRIWIYSDGDLENHDNRYDAISDERLKQDIVDASSQWDDIKNLRVRKYRFKTDVEAYGENAVAHIGLIAQETEQITPGLVNHRLYDAVVDDDGNEIHSAVDQYSVKYSILYMKCVKALQEAMARIETLEAQVSELQGT